jgi:uncharacterized membrane protein
MILSPDSHGTPSASAPLTDRIGEAGRSIVDGIVAGRGDRNVGQAERMASAVAGGALAVLGLRARSLPGLVAAAAGAALVYRGVSGQCSLYSALGIDTAHPRQGSGGAEPQEYFRRGIHLEEVFTVNRSPWQLYEFWRNFENLPKFMNHLEAVKVLDDKRSHWVAKGPAGTKVEWDAEIINDEPNALIAWRSLANADVDNAGSVRFVPGVEGRGTEVKVVIDYIPPAGRVGSMIAYLLGEEPTIQVREDLRRFKQLMETGEVPTVEGQSRA